MSLRDLTDMHLRALSNAASLHAWAHRPRSRDLDTAEVDVIANAAGGAALRLLRLWEAQREVEDAQAAIDAAQRRMHVARRRLVDAESTYSRAQQSSPSMAQAWQG